MQFTSLSTGPTFPGVIPSNLPLTNDGSLASEADKIEQFLTVFGGEVMVSFRKALVTNGAWMMKTVPDGFESVTYRQVGKANVKRHLSGQSLLLDFDATSPTPEPLLTSMETGRLQVFLDRPLTASTLVDRWENRRNSFDTRQEVAQEIGKDLADQVDYERLLLVAKAAQGNLTQTSDFISSIPTAGATLEDPNVATDGSALLDALKEASIFFHEANMLANGEKAYVALRPRQYSLLVENQDLLNRDYGGTNGIFSDGTVFKAWGMELRPTTGLPTADESSNILMTRGVHGENYAVDARNTVALCWIDKAFGSATADAISVESTYEHEYKADLISGDTSMGHTAIFPAGSFQIRTATP